MSYVDACMTCVHTHAYINTCSPTDDNPSTEKKPHPAINCRSELGWAANAATLFWILP